MMNGAGLGYRSARGIPAGLHSPVGSFPRAGGIALGP
jgi:hypothetical protein